MMAPWRSASFNETGQRADVAIHGEDAVGDQQLAAGDAVEFGEDLFGGGEVFVREDVDLGAREAAAIDDAGVIQFVGDDVIFGSENRRDGSGIGGESGLKHDAGFDVLERGDAFLELHVQRHGAGNGAHRARARAVLPDGLDGGFAEFGMRGEAEVVVGSEVDDLLAVEARLVGAFRFEDAEALVDAFGFPLVKLVVQVGERIHVRSQPAAGYILTFLADLDIQPLDLLIQRGERHAQAFGGFGLAPVGLLQALP